MNRLLNILVPFLVLLLFSLGSYYQGVTMLCDLFVPNGGTTYPATFDLTPTKILIAMCFGGGTFFMAVLVFVVGEMKNQTPTEDDIHDDAP